MWDILYVFLCKFAFDSQFICIVFENTAKFMLFYIYSNEQKLEVECNWYAIIKIWLIVFSKDAKDHRIIQIVYLSLMSGVKMLGKVDLESTFIDIFLNGFCKKLKQILSVVQIT